MKKFNILKLLFCFIAILLITLGENLYSQTANQQNALDKTEKLGKENPFDKVKPIAAKIQLLQNRGNLGANMVETKPDLFVETVMLKFLQAVNLEKVIKMISSDYGTVQTDEESNSLIICDTKENLEKIKTQVRKDPFPRSKENIERLAHIYGKEAGVNIAEPYHILRTEIC